MEAAHRQQVVVPLVDELHVALKQGADALAQGLGALGAAHCQAAVLRTALPLGAAQQRPIQLLHLLLQLPHCCVRLRAPGLLCAPRKVLAIDSNRPSQDE